MLIARRLRRAARRLLGRTALPVWHHGAYRLPIPALEAQLHLEPRRADLVLWTLQEAGLVSPRSVRTPTAVSLADLHRVHDDAYLRSLTEPAVLGHVLGLVDPSLPVDTVLDGYRTACGGTLGAARHAVAARTATLNLLGGFHHAYPDKGSGLCPYNDVAVAIAALRHGGFSGRIAVLDLDAHPPDGTAACLRDDERAWIGSLSGSDWGPLDGVDETVLPPGTGDAVYLEALDALLRRMPPASLVFVVAGADVLAGDHLGLLDLTLAGVRERDRRVFASIADTPSVWLPAGGYQDDAWRALAGTAFVLAGTPDRPLAAGFDPLGSHFGQVATTMRPRSDADEWFSEEDIATILGPARSDRLLGVYSAQWIEHALFAYGILPHYERLGYRDFRVRIQESGVGQRFRLEGSARGRTWLLVECELDRLWHDGKQLLFVNWLTLRHPLGVFTDAHPRLPGQEVPGPGLAREAGELMGRVAVRLGLEGVAFCPSSFHVAFTARHHFAFADPERQQRFEALVRDLGDRPLLQVSQAVAEGRVTMDGGPYAWEPDVMVHWLDGSRAPASSGGPRFSMRASEPVEAA